jgi:hypothetical protein
MSNTIRSRATLPSRYSWKSVPSYSIRLPVAGMPGGSIGPAVGHVAAPPERRPRTVGRDQGTTHALDGEGGEGAPGEVE